MTKRVRMVTQVSGTRDGVPWPEPGVEIELSDAEARAAVQGGTAVNVDHEADRVLVPPAGVHVPGRTAFGDVHLVEAPADAVADPDAAVAAAQTARQVELTGDGADHTVPAGTGVQQHSGAAMTKDQIDEALSYDEETARDYGLPTPAERAPMSSGAKAGLKSRQERYDASAKVAAQSTAQQAKAAEKQAAESSAQSTSVPSKSAEKQAADTSATKSSSSKS